MGDTAAYSLLFSSSFLAATLVPGSSEATLAALVVSRPAETWALMTVATIGNTLGSAVNWMLGRWFAELATRKWFPASSMALQAAVDRFGRFGNWLLLFAWLPVIGDPITVAAGVLRVDFRLFIVLVAVGKAARYLVVLWGARALMPFF
ncbi:YqaA family protein [Dongia sp.]|uniref:YqaA family protein n=1 Tax=Dongia sp. TaxID=1977262 RepID=UPI003750B7AF